MRRSPSASTPSLRRASPDVDPDVSLARVFVQDAGGSIRNDRQKIPLDPAPPLHVRRYGAPPASLSRDSYGAGKARGRTAYAASAFAFMWPSQAASEESSIFCIDCRSALTGSPEKDSVVET